MTCTAWECPHEATKRVTGRDYDDSPFVEVVCGYHADYLAEHDGDETPVTVEDLP